jgi:hypothetical protein
MRLCSMSIKGCERNCQFFSLYFTGNSASGTAGNSGRVLIFAAPVRGKSRRMGFASLSAGVRAAPAIEVGFAVEGDRTLLSILATLSAVILRSRACAASRRMGHGLLHPSRLARARTSRVNAIAFIPGMTSARVARPKTQSQLRRLRANAGGITMNARLLLGGRVRGWHPPGFPA